MDSANEEYVFSGPEVDSTELEELNKTQKEAEAAAEKLKKTVRVARPKLDEVRLIHADRGLEALRMSTEKLTFKSNLSEWRKLELLLGHYRHWAHRLMPSLSFEESILKLEKLGTKKMIQTYLIRLRLGYETCLKEQLELPSKTDEVTPLFECVTDPTPSQPVADEALPSVHASVAQTSVSSTSLTPEQRERMRLSRLAAVERRRQLANSQMQSRLPQIGEDSLIHATGSDTSATRLDALASDASTVKNLDQPVIVVFPESDVAMVIDESKTSQNGPSIPDCNSGADGVDGAGTVVDSSLADDVTLCGVPVDCAFSSNDDMAKDVAVDPLQLVDDTSNNWSSKQCDENQRQFNNSQLHVIAAADPTDDQSDICDITRVDAAVVLDAVPDDDVCRVNKSKRRRIVLDDSDIDLT